MSHQVSSDVSGPEPAGLCCGLPGTQHVCLPFPGLPAATGEVREALNSGEATGLRCITSPAVKWG